jgi:hypothetical protein
MPCILDLYPGFGLVKPASAESMVNFIEEEKEMTDR